MCPLTCLERADRIQSITSLAIGFLSIPISRYSYNVFLILHDCCAVINAVSLWLHIGSGTHTADRIVLISSMSVSTAAWVLNVFYEIYCNFTWDGRTARCPKILDLEHLYTSHRKGSEKVDKTAALLQIRLTRDWKVEPGQHVLLRVLCWTHGLFLQRLPLTIAWWDIASDYRIVYAIVDRRTGWGVTAVKKAIGSRSLPVFVHGPFGRSLQGNTGDFGRFETVLLFASFTGLFALLPLLRDLIQRRQYECIRTTHIKLVWNAPLPSAVWTQALVWIQAILDEECTSVVRSSCFYLWAIIDHIRFLTSVYTSSIPLAPAISSQSTLDS